MSFHRVGRPYKSDQRSYLLFYFLLKFIDIYPVIDIIVDMVIFPTFFSSGGNFSVSKMPSLLLGNPALGNFQQKEVMLSFSACYPVQHRNTTNNNMVKCVLYRIVSMIAASKFY